MKRLLSVLFLFLIFSGFALAQQGNYPQLDISGFKKWEYKKADVTPNKNYFSGLTQLGGYYPTFTGGPWQERLQLRIIGQLSENLSVTYDLEQQPETPDRYDVKVKYYNNELTFGDFTANFTGNEFATASKFLNGVMLTAKDGWYDIITVPSAKLKSQTQSLASQQGNNTKGPYNLGHGSIVEGSEKIELNDIPQIRNIDYTIDYFEGKVTFNQILTQADEFKYTYEFTNILDLFFPALSKRDFFGFQSRFTIDPEEFGKEPPKIEPVIESIRETFPTAGTVEPEVMEREASGQYHLLHTPVVKFSEKLTFMGTQLTKNEDYIIRYAAGEIKLLTRFLPTSEEVLVVEYDYYQTAEDSEAIAGIGSRGPYNLAHLNVVPESERIEVDSKLFVRDLDYTINYALGEIVFGVVIGPTSQIKAKYRYNVMELPEAPPSKFPKELIIGTTYLKESAKKSAGTATATVIESFSGQSIIDDQYLLYLQNKPVVPSSEGATFVVKVDGVTLTPEVDYAIPTTEVDPNTGDIIVTPTATLAYINDRDDPSDGYDTGTIKFINQATITSTSSVTVTYSYYKSVVGKYSGVGDGTRGPFYLRNVRNLVPGSETVQVWEQGSSVITTYTRNSSFDADAGDTGYSINYNADNPSITFNNDLSTTKNFQIIYQYVPPRADEGGDISQSVYGFDGKFKIGEVFKIETAYAKSETDQVFVAETSIETFTGNGTKNYNLHSPKDIIEGSEQIYVNDHMLNKDIDYFISYSTPGQITFYYITPTSQDAMSVEYQYQSQSGMVVGQTVKADSAFKLGAETKLFNDTLTLSGNTKHIGFDFTPMGGTSIGLGSRYKEYGIRYEPQVHSMVTTYSYKENNNPIGTTRERFLRSYDNSYSLGLNPGDLARIDVSYRNYRTMDDLSSSVTTHSSDVLQDTYSFGLTPNEWKRGVFGFTHKYDLRKTYSKTDYIERDPSSFAETNIDYRHANAGLKITDRVSLGYDYQISEPKTTSLKTSTVEATREALSSHNRSIDTSYNVNVDLTLGSLDKWTARVSLLDHRGETLIKSFNATDEVATTKNETYHMDLVPISAINTSIDHNRQERSTVVVDGVNPRTERTSANARWSPQSWFSTGWNGSNSESSPETGEQYTTTGISHAYNATWSPISWDRFKLSSRFSLGDNLQTAPSGTYEGIATDTDTFTQNYTATLTPHPNAPVNLGFTLENYQNKNDHPVVASQIDTETENQTVNAGVTITPIPALSLGSNYNIKTTRVIKDLKVSPEVRTKTIIDSKVTYQLFSWGMLVYDRQDEHNGGEVQAGSMADLNIKKVTETLSLNVTLPVDNPVLTSFVFIASLKTVDYRNLNNDDDNFKASLTTFEGSLNF